MSRYQLFDAFIDVILVVDAAGNLHYANAAAALLFDASARRLNSGRPLSQFVTFEPNILAGSLDELASVQEATQMREVAFNTPSRSDKGWAQVSVQPQPDYMYEDGTEAKGRWIIYFRDVSLEKALHVKYKGELDQKESVINELSDARKALEEYSKNLEQMVNNRTLELTEANRLIKTVLDSLSQGILVFDKTGKCLPVFSKVCLNLLESNPVDRQIEDVLQLGAKEKKNFEAWREAVFDELLDFEDMAPLAPNAYKHSKNLEVALEYHPMRDTEGKLIGLVVVATDRTREVQAIRKAEKERELVTKVTQVARNRDAFRMFITDAKRLMGEMKKPSSLDLVDVARRLHTIKGAAASFSMNDIAHECHLLEDELRKLDPKNRAAFDARLAKQSEEILVMLDKEIATLTELLGSLGYESEAQLVELSLDQVREWAVALCSAKELSQAREVGFKILRETSEKSAAAGVSHFGSSLPELARSLGKADPVFEVIGDVKLPGNFAQDLLASFVHVFRNSVYHGLEPAALRKSVGKPEAGRIQVRFDKVERDETSWLSIAVSDDGSGINPEKIRKKLMQLGNETFASRSDEEVIQVILRDDFSTSDGVNAVAGRGVGLAAVASEAKRLGGTVTVKSEMGKGMTLLVQVPLPRPAAIEPTVVRKAA